MLSTILLLFLFIALVISVPLSNHDTAPTNLTRPLAKSTLVYLNALNSNFSLPDTSYPPSNISSGNVEGDLTDLYLTGSDLTTLGYDPSFDWHPNRATLQAWMGKDKTTVGSMVGRDLFVTVWRLLDKNCPASMKWGICDHIPNAEFQSTCMVQWPALTTKCTTGIWKIKAKWSNEEIRKSLIGATAGMLQAATENTALGPTNCFDMAGTKGCNVGDVVRVNFPPSPNNEPNFMHIWLWNYYTDYGAYDCCSPKADVRGHMDTVMDLMKDEIHRVFPEHAGDAWYRDSRCIINGWKVCGD